MKALTLYKSILDRGLSQAGPTNDTREDLQNLFKQGRLGMMMTAPFLINQIAKEAPSLEYGIVPVPVATTQATYAVQSVYLGTSTPEAALNAAAAKANQSLGKRHRTTETRFSVRAPAPR